MAIENKFGGNLELHPVPSGLKGSRYNQTNSVADFVKQFFHHEACAAHRLRGNKNPANVSLQDIGLLLFLLVRFFLFS